MRVWQPFYLQFVLYNTILEEGSNDPFILLESFRIPYYERNMQISISNLCKYLLQYRMSSFTISSLQILQLERLVDPST